MWRSCDFLNLCSTVCSLVSFWSFEHCRRPVIFPVWQEMEHVWFIFLFWNIYCVLRSGFAERNIFNGKCGVIKLINQFFSKYLPMKLVVQVRSASSFLGSYASVSIVCRKIKWLELDCMFNLSRKITQTAPLPEVTSYTHLRSMVRHSLFNVR